MRVNWEHIKEWHFQKPIKSYKDINVGLCGATTRAEPNDIGMTNQIGDVTCEVCIKVRYEDQSSSL